MLHIIEHTLVESIKLFPFLFLTYLVMEYLEGKTGEVTEKVVKKAGSFGPLIGGIAGVVPQCGFSAAASNLYAARVITAGTLIAIYLSTSDEMLPILISAKIEGKIIVRILALKVIIAVAAGFLVDILWKSRKGNQKVCIHEMCEHDHCHCDNGIVRPALRHSVKILGFIILVTFALNLVLHNGGEEVLEKVLVNEPVLGPVIAGVIGLIPNCASSVLQTQLYVEGAMGFGTMMAGLLVGAGIGVLVLCKVNRDRKDTAKIVGLLYAIGVSCGIFLQIFVK